MIVAEIFLCKNLNNKFLFRTKLNRIEIHRVFIWKKKKSLRNICDMWMSGCVNETNSATLIVKLQPFTQITPHNHKRLFNVHHYMHTDTRTRTYRCRFEFYSKWMLHIYVNRLTTRRIQLDESKRDNHMLRRAKNKFVSSKWTQQNILRQPISIWQSVSKEFSLGQSEW